MRAITLVVGFLVMVGLADAAPSRAQSGPPERVGRVSHIGGAVSVRPAGGGWSEALVNHPVATGMVVRTLTEARAELRIGGDVVALSGASELDLAQVDDHVITLVLRQGRIGVGLGRLAPGESIEIDLPQGGVWLAAPGEYDIAVASDGKPARIAVFAGRARFVGGGSDSTVAPGSTAVLNGATSIAVSFADAAADDFDDSWGAGQSSGRPPDQLQHLSPDMIGAEALDANGSWESVADYGVVWFPDVPDGWVPYRDGCWRWIAPWGWTWIDDAPWGFAPAHYGRWARIDKRWAWVPGRPIAHPAYAPALVAFLGTAGVGLSYPDAIGPAAAWFPLAPGEVYWPGYNAELDAIRRINDPDVANAGSIALGADGGPPAAIVTASYQNRRFASVVPRAVFAAGRPVAPALVQLPEPRLEDAPLIFAAPQLPPPASPGQAEHRPAVATAGAAVSGAALAARSRFVASVQRDAARVRARIALLRHPPHRPGVSLVRSQIAAATLPHRLGRRLHHFAAHAPVR